jgi:hypothetical protein
MGGIVLIEPNKREPTILTPEILKKLIQDPEFEIRLTGPEIDDKAKGDFLSKSIVVFQTTWFMAQCVARFVQKIAITELEVVTLALASLNAVMSFFWWSKPLGLTVRVEVHLRRKLDRKIGCDQVSDRLQGRDKMPNVFLTSQNDLDQLLSSLTEKYALRVFNAVWLSQREPFFLRCFFVLQGYVLILFFLLVMLPIISIALSLYGVMASHSIPTGATHVPTFYSPVLDSEVLIFRIIFPILGAVFGGLHCIGWTLTFPTEAEKKIWELGSMTITIIPVLYFLITFSSRLSAPLPATWNLRPVRIVIRAITGILRLRFPGFTCLPEFPSL